MVSEGWTEHQAKVSLESSRRVREICNGDFNILGYA